MKTIFSMGTELILSPLKHTAEGKGEGRIILNPPHPNLHPVGEGGKHILYLVIQSTIMTPCQLRPTMPTLIKSQTTGNLAMPLRT